MAILVTYDIKQNHKIFKAKLLEKGFFKCLKDGQGQLKELPDTTVIYNGNDIEAARQMFIAALGDVHPAPDLSRVFMMITGAGYYFESDTRCV
ncbi:hypothetical protein ACFSM5_05810 [Lacibacterium aquatile]|uniref:Uncharacterized protein n=1 Tax=Lacibacterium aquatile TaxID=1168082 RepID=A0ABW5DMX9_9PROT